MKPKPNKNTFFCRSLLMKLSGFIGFVLFLFFCQYQYQPPILKILTSKPSKVMVPYQPKTKEKNPKNKYKDPLELKTTALTQAEVAAKVKVVKNNKKLRQQLLIFEGNLPQLEKQALHDLRKICPEGVVRRYMEWHIHRPEYINILEGLEMLLQLNQEPVEQEMKDFKKFILFMEEKFLNICSILRRQDIIVTQVNRNLSVSERERLISLFHSLEEEAMTNYISFHHGLEILKQKLQNLPDFEEMPLDFYEMTFIHHWFQKAKEQNK